MIKTVISIYYGEAMEALCRHFCLAMLWSRGRFAHARPVPQNLAGGLGALVESNIAVKSRPNTADLQWLCYPAGRELRQSRNPGR